MEVGWVGRVPEGRSRDEGDEIGGDGMMYKRRDGVVVKGRRGGGGIARRRRDGEEE